MEYEEDNMLMLSGIQHYMFCPRQWALVHIEQQWLDNKLTVEGELLHKNVDDPFYRQKNGNALTLRSVPIASKKLGLYGLTDAVELIPSMAAENSITHTNYPGYWKPFPIEYKRGHSKPDKYDEVQLAAQVICLEEMYQIKIDSAALYYNEIRHREYIFITSLLRDLTYKCASEMHEIYKSGITPKAINKPCCKNCSLADLCLPELNSCQPASIYLNKNLYEKTS
ncbi:MAG: CRISPR-associated protein Cas4 [Parabacteroides sp.]|jgi:CRISPR-associated protein Cas4|nr:CRISPR-associated protein Cas4 [Parabacteroides sp.]